MATVHIVNARTFLNSINGPHPVPSSSPVVKQTITSSGSSQATSISASDGYWVVTASGGNVWIKAGSSPTAEAGNDWLILDGQTRDFAVSGPLEKLAVIDA